MFLRLAIVGAAVLGVAALAAHILAFLDPGEPARWVYAGWGAAGALALVGAAASATAERGHAGLGWVLWAAAAVAWLAGVGYALGETELPSVASLYWALAVLLALAGLGVQIVSGSAYAAPLREALVVLLATAAIGFVGSGYAERVGVPREVFAAQVVLPALLLALMAVTLGGRVGLWSSSSFVFVAWSGIVAAAALTWPAHYSTTGAATGHWSDPLWSLGLVVLGAFGLRRAVRRDEVPKHREISAESGIGILVQGFAIVGLLGLVFFLRSYVDLLFWWAFGALCVFVVRIYWSSRGAQDALRALAATKDAMERERDFVSAVIDSSDSLVCVLDRRGRIVSFNRACEELTGYSFSEVRDREYWELFLLPEEVERAQVELAGMESKPKPRTRETFWRTKDGNRRLISWVQTPLTDERGSVTHVVTTGVDFTNRWTVAGG